MTTIDPVVKRETIYIASFVIVLSMLMEAVFLIIGKWDYTVLLGNLLGAAAAVGNFFFMGITIQKSLQKSDEERSSFIKLSYTYRTLAIIAAALVGFLCPVFNGFAVVIPLFFPRIAIFLKPFVDRNYKKKEGDTDIVEE
ncbi:MAG: hypothetical protein IKT14_03205 [Clostridiales bacterium]|nr:hypothetical protein [Clostridiales bacterium]